MGFLGACCLFFGPKTPRSTIRGRWRRDSYVCRRSTKLATCGFAERCRSEGFRTAFSASSTCPVPSIWAFCAQFPTRCPACGGGGVATALTPSRRPRSVPRVCGVGWIRAIAFETTPLLENGGQTRANRRYSVVERVGVGSSLSTDFFIAFSHNAMNWDYAVS